MDMEQGDLAPTEPRLVHFKCKHDSDWDYKSIADTLFLPDQKILVVGEKWRTNPHVHFQGYTRDAPRTLANKLSDLAKRHSSRNPNHRDYVGPKARPMSQGRGTVTVTGFQYMNKEPFSNHNPLYYKGFTEAELLELQAASAAHVDSLKTSVAELLAEHEMDFSNDWKTAFKKAWSIVIDNYREVKRNVTRYTKKDVFHYLYHHEKCPKHIAYELALQV